MCTYYLAVNFILQVTYLQIKKRIKTISIPHQGLNTDKNKYVPK